jgi:hypothetical protein
MSLGALDQRTLGKLKRLIPVLNKQRISLICKSIVIPTIKGSMMIQLNKVGGNQIQKA